MAGSTVMLDDPAAFTGLLTRWAVPDAVKDKLHDAGYNTMALLAHALPSLDDLEAFVESLLGRAVGADPTVPIFSPEAAALRRVLKECINLAGPAGASSPAAPTPAAARPKLQSADVQSLVVEFSRKYPSELLRPEVMPSLPFLNAVKDAVDSKQLSWISWRLRTSESDEQALTERRKPRTDSQMLQSLLGPVSDELVVDVPQHLPLESVIRRYLDRMSYALAVLDACHLLTLKKLSEKFVSLATAIPIDRSLRGPTLAEAMDADRVLWSAICSLQKEYGWSLQDCVSELTHVRSDLHNALAPRPKVHQGGGEPRGKRQRTEPPPAPHPNPRAKAKSKAKPRKSGDAAPSKDRVSISNWPSNWARQIGGAAVEDGMDLDPPPDFAPVASESSQSEAESFADSILSKSVALSCKSVERLADLLLQEAPDLDDRFSSGASVSAGLYHRIKVGLRKVCGSHPSSVRVLNSLISSMSPGFFHSSFVLIDGIASEAHCDTANSDLPNVVIPISCFSGGELRVAHPSGADVMMHDGVKHSAVSLPVCRGPVIFTASSCLHEVLPFEGRRLVLVGYTLRACESLAADTSARLSSLGFRPPSPSVVTGALPIAPRALALTEEQRDLLPRPNSVSAVASGHHLRTGISPDLPQLPISDFVSDCNSGRFFLDVCSGAGAPVSAAMQALGKDCFQPVDIIHCQDFDLLEDEFFAQLLALCSSGVVGAAIASPPCGEFSLLKLRPGGPPPCRTPEEPLGCISNDWHQSMVAQNSALLHDRCRELLSSVAALGGCIVFEQPPSSMTFLTETMQQWISSTLSFGAQVAACHHGMDVSKRWLFLSNRPDILDLASECHHGSRAHKAVWGVRAADGSFLSRMTAAYPKSLAAALAALLGRYTSSQGRLLPCAEWRSVLPMDPVWPQLSRRVEDGAGVNSTACWITPQADDHLAGLRKKWTQRLVDSRLCLRICSTLRAGTDCPPISAEELQPFLDDLCCFCEVPESEIENFLSIPPGQPFRLNVLEKLLALTKDPESDLCQHLRKGVRIGVDHELQPSTHWPLRTADPVVSDLVICEGSWKSASDHPDQVRELLAQEIAEGWIVERPSVQYLHDNFPAVAIGKLGLVLAEGRSPRLTVDSSISGVTAACQIPNHMLLPRISDVEDCAPSCLGRQPWITISLDVRKAHRMVMVEYCDQALLAFTFEGRAFTSSTLNFGARASAFWWARVGGALLRLSHAAIWLSHLLWGYVDDFLGGFRGDVAPISASIWILLLLALGVPLSWPKCVWSSECIWIGWSINLESWICELPSAKISKILDQIAELLSAGDKVRFKTLESLIGRLLWVTGLWTVLRPLLSPLYAALQRLPASSVGVSPELWAAIKRNIAEDCVLTRSVGHPSFHKGACITRAANTFVSCKQDLDQVPFRKRRLWVEVKDPGHPLRVLGDVGRSSLIAWRAIFQGTPFLKALRSPLPLKVIAEADAFADADVSGLGGYAMWPSGRTVWFSIRKDSQEWAALTSWFPPPLQTHISALELLAQLLLLWCVFATLPSNRGLCRACLRSDNSGAEACASKGLSSVLSMSEIVKKFLAFQAWSGVQAEIEHVPGYRNELADALSRLTPNDIAPLPLGDRVHPPLQWLLEQRLFLEPASASWPPPFKTWMSRP
ncbi:unnamed protein product [Symbiodinium sp. CCMP2592]|nr:unnamed protein product [Symbiodinium sp. CCMP2592]